MKNAKRNLVVLFMLLAGVSCGWQKLTPTTISEHPNNGRDYIVMIHGLFNSSERMEDFEDYFAGKGYQVLNIDYPSTKYPIEELDKKFIKPMIDAIPVTESQKIHFITHSLGGLVLRHYLTHNRPPQLGQVIMLSPPNHGSELADLLLKRRLVQRVAGPAAMELRTLDNRFFQKLGPIDYPLGIIAGNKSYTRSTERHLPGMDDGMVAISSMKLKGMKDFIILNEHHRGLTRNLEAMEQANHFLKNSRFKHQNLSHQAEKP